MPRTQRLLVAAFGLSVVLHLLGGAWWARAVHVVAGLMHRLPEQHEREQQVAMSDVVRLERRTIPRPAVASRAHPAVRPLPRPRPPVVPKRAAVVPTPRPLPSVRATARPAPSAPPEFAHRVLHAAPRASGAGAPAARPRTAALSAAQIDALDARFAKTIAASRQDLATIQKQTEEQPVATKRYPMQFAGLQANLRRGEGYIEPITAGQRVGDTMWYYTHYTYMWPDGQIEDDDIPWPFHFPVDHDLFALHVHLIPLQLPPPDFRLTRPLKPFLAHFVATRGQG